MRLQNMKTNVILEETNIPEDLKNVISNDYILRYKAGTYIWEEELTDKMEELFDDKSDKSGGGSNSKINKITERSLGLSVIL